VPGVRPAQKESETTKSSSDTTKFDSVTIVSDLTQTFERVQLPPKLLRRVFT